MCRAMIDKNSETSCFGGIFLKKEPLVKINSPKPSSVSIMTVFLGFDLNLRNSASAPLKSGNTSSIYGCIVDAMWTSDSSHQHIWLLDGNITYIWHQKL